MNTHNQSVQALSLLSVWNAGLLKAACQYIESTPCEPLNALVNLTVMEPFTPWEFPGMGIFFISLSHLQAWCPCAFPTATTDSEEQRVYNHTHTRAHTLSSLSRIPSGWRNRWQWKVIHTLLHVPHAGEENPVSALVATNHSAQIPGDSIALCWGPAKTGLLSTFYSLPAS